MDITLIVAVDKNLAIGKNNQLLFSCPEDMQWFKENTLNKPVIMGRKTFESIGRPLPNRSNIVVTRNPTFEVTSLVMGVRSLDEAFQWASLAPSEEVMVIGGGDIYRQALPYANRLLITHFEHASLNTDTFFPVIDSTVWKGVKVRDGETSTPELPFSFWEYTRK